MNDVKYDVNDMPKTLVCGWFIFPAFVCHVWGDSAGDLVGIDPACYFVLIWFQGPWLT